MPRFFGRRLGVPRERDLGVAVDAPRHLRVVDRQWVLAQQVLDDEDALGEADVRQCGRRDDVADGVHLRLAGAAVRVDVDEAALAHDDARLCQTQLVGIRAPANRHDDDVDLDRFAFAELHGRAGSFGVGRVAVHLDAGTHGDAALGEGPLDDLGRVFVASGQDLGQRLEHGRLRAEVSHHRCELATDRTAADDHRGLGQARPRQQLVGSEDQSAVDLEAGDRPRHRPGGQDDMITDELDVARRAARDAHDATGVKRAFAVVDRDLALLEQPGQPAEELIDDGLLALSGSPRSR